MERDAVRAPGGGASIRILYDDPVVSPSFGELLPLGTIMRPR